MYQSVSDKAFDRKKFPSHGQNKQQSGNHNRNHKHDLIAATVSGNLPSNNLSFPREHRVLCVLHSFKGNNSDHTGKYPWHGSLH